MKALALVISLAALTGCAIQPCPDEACQQQRMGAYQMLMQNQQRQQQADQQFYQQQMQSINANRPVTTNCTSTNQPMLGNQVTTQTTCTSR